MLLIGHRGTRFDFDENTIESFEIALKSGAEFIEFDVRKLKDNNLIVFHDSSLLRTTRHIGLIKNLTYPEIKDLRTNKRKRSIPLLSEVFKILKGKTKFLIDLKDEAIYKEVINLVLNYELLNDCIFSGRNFNELKMIKNLFPKSKICYNITKGKGLSLFEFFKLANNHKLVFKPDLISLKSDLIDSIFIQVCHENEIMVLAWNFINYSNPLEKITTLIKMGVDGILFDNYRNILLVKELL